MTQTAPKAPNRRLYVFPDLGRAGLGNLMVPWARAEIFRHTHALPMLAPRWTRLKIGPLLRGERDLRMYTGLFNTQGYIRGLQRQWILRRARVIPEAQALDALRDAKPSDPTTVLQFEGMGSGNMLAGMLEHRDLLRRRIREMLTPRIRQQLDQAPIDFEVAAHVRRGDKPTLAFREPMKGWNFGMSDQWFINVINNIRAAAGREVKVKIFSDAPADRLSAILAIPGVTLAPPRPSIVDILLLSKAKVLIPTGFSSFALWSVFFGSAAAVWYPGTINVVNPNRPGWDSEADLDGNITQPAQSAIREALG